MSIPLGFQIRLADDVTRAGGGSVLIGGSPLTAMRLSNDAASMIAGGRLAVTDPASAFVGERLLATNLGLPHLETSPIAGPMDLTVVVPVRDRPDQLARTLAFLDNLSVLVIDDASLDPRAVARVARTHGADVVHLEHNVGPAAARNVGLRGVTTEYVAFVDSDVTVATDTLLGLTAHFADPSVVLVGPHVRARSVNAVPRWYERYDISTPSLGLGERPVVVLPAAAVAWLPSACLVGRTEVLRQGFDDSMRVGEDVDLVWRLVDQGWRVRYDPSFSALHDTRPTLRGWMARKFVYGTGGAVLATRHPDKVVTAIISPAMALACLSLLSRSRWSAPAALTATAWGARTVRRALPDVPERNRIAVEVSLRGLAWTLRQESALLLRHWWPFALLSALVSRSARRIIVTAVFVDVVASRFERPDLPILRTFAGRRLDDFAYGAGLWWGALRARSLRCLCPRISRTAVGRTRRTPRVPPR